MSDGYLELSADHVRFEPVSKITNVFFDDTNKEIISVRGGGTLGVVVKGVNSSYTFRMENRDVITSLKFSPDHSILAVQRMPNAVELRGFNNGELGPGFIQESKSRHAIILGFIWVSSDDFLLITDHGLEWYQLAREKVGTRHMRSYALGCHWFAWHSECGLLLLCSGVSPSSSTLQPFLCNKGNGITKLTKFEAEVNGSSVSQPSSLILTERDIHIGCVYATVTLCVLRHPSSPSVAAHLDVYIQNKEGHFKKTHICKLELTSRFAVNIIDSLIVVHHQATKTSLIFDIRLNGESGSGTASLYPVAVPCSMRHFSLSESTGVPSSTEGVMVPCELYASTWVVFQPDIIIDARLGCMWQVTLCLDSFSRAVTDKCQLVDCLLRRKRAKPLILATLIEVIENGQFGALGQIFDKINAIYKQHLSTVLQAQMGESVSSPSCHSPTSVDSPGVVIEQADIYSGVLAPLMGEADKRENGTVKGTETHEANVSMNITLRAMVGVALEYTRSLGALGMAAQPFLLELVVNALVRSRQLYQLHQLLQYRVLADSKPLACLLLSLVGVYAAGEQLSLDMLRRLDTGHDEIVEILLSRKRVVAALRYTRSVGLSESVSARKFLEAALESGEASIFFATFTFLCQRNVRTRGSQSFMKGEHCEPFVEHYRKLFGEPPDYSEIT